MPTSDQICRSLRRADEAAWARLSPREQELCNISTRGLRTAEIAREMGLKPASVKSLRKAVRRKIGWRANVYFEA